MLSVAATVTTTSVGNSGGASQAGAAAGLHRKYNSSDSSSDADSVYYEAVEALTPAQSPASSSFSDQGGFSYGGQGGGGMTSLGSFGGPVVSLSSPLRAAVMASASIGTHAQQQQQNTASSASSSILAARLASLMPVPVNQHYRRDHFRNSGASTAPPSLAIQYAAANDLSRLHDLEKTSQAAVIRDRDAFKRTPLMIAAMEGHADIVEFLLSCDADPFARDLGGITVLMHAVLGNREHVVRILLHRNADPNVQGSQDGLTPLMIACMLGLEGICTALLQAGADVNLVNLKYETALMFACHVGRKSIVDQLLYYGADVGAINVDGAPSFVFAASNNHTDICQALIAHADRISRDGRVTNVIRVENLPGLQNKPWDDASPLHIVCTLGNARLVEFVLDCPLTPLLIATKGVICTTPHDSSASHVQRLWWRDRDGRTCLTSAVIAKSTDVFQLLLSRAGPTAISLLNTVDKDRESVLHYIARGGTVAFLTMLCARVDVTSLKIDQLNRANETPLLIAISRQHVEMAKELLTMGARGEGVPGAVSPLVLACHDGLEDAACMLIRHLHDKFPRRPKSRHNNNESHGTNDHQLESLLNTPDANNWTPLMFACGKGMLSVVKLLVARGADVNIRGRENGATSLMLAVSAGRSAIVECLINAGARLHDQTNNGKTALDLAMQLKRSKITTLLQNAAHDERAKLNAAATLPSLLPTPMLPSAVTGGHYCDLTALSKEDVAPGEFGRTKRPSNSVNDSYHSSDPCHASTPATSAPLPPTIDEQKSVTQEIDRVQSSAQDGPLPPRHGVHGPSLIRPPSRPAVHPQTAQSSPSMMAVSSPFFTPSFGGLIPAQAPTTLLPNASGLPMPAMPLAATPGAAAWGRPLYNLAATGRVVSAPATAPTPTLSLPTSPPTMATQPMNIPANHPRLREVGDADVASNDMSPPGRGHNSPSFSSSAPPSTVQKRASSSPTSAMLSTASPKASSDSLVTSRPLAVTNGRSSSLNLSTTNGNSNGGRGRRGNKSETTLSSTASTPNSSSGELVDKRLDTVGAIRYNRSLRLGTGSHGTQVYQGFYREKVAAVKRIPRHDPDSSTGSDGVADVIAEREIQLLINLSKRKENAASLHKTSAQSSSTNIKDPRTSTLDNIIGEGRHNIVQYFGKEMNEDFVFLAMEKCTHTLLKVVKDSRSSADIFALLYQEPITLVTGEPLPPMPAPEPAAQEIAGQHPLVARHLPVEQVQVIATLRALQILFSLFRGVAYLHSLNLVHNDLKPANILLTDDYEVKIADMGLMRSVSDDHSSFCFQPGVDGSVIIPTGLGGFVAPEVILDNRKTCKVDIFSAGCLAFYVLTLGGHPFEMSGVRGQRDSNIIAGRYDLSRLNHLPLARQLIESMIVFDPTQRITMADALMHPFFDSVRPRSAVRN